MRASKIETIGLAAACFTRKNCKSEQKKREIDDVNVELNFLL